MHWLIVVVATKSVGGVHAGWLVGAQRCLDHRSDGLPHSSLARRNLRCPVKPLGADEGNSRRKLSTDFPVYGGKGGYPCAARC